MFHCFSFFTLADSQIAKHAQLRRDRQRPARIDSLRIATSPEIYPKNIRNHQGPASVMCALVTNRWVQKNELKSTSDIPFDQKPNTRHDITQFKASPFHCVIAQRRHHLCGKLYAGPRHWFTSLRLIRVIGHSDVLRFNRPTAIANRVRWP